MNHHARRTRPSGRVGFPSNPDPAWTPQQRDRWEAARRIADAHPGTPGHGDWTVDRLPTPVGAFAAFAVTGAGGAASIAVAVHGGPALYVGLVGIVASGLAGMTLAWHLPPADLTPAVAAPTVASAGTDANLLAAAQDGVTW